jgi:alanine racemase
MRPTRLEINLSNLKYNINQIKNIISDKTDIIAVLKASAYGNGAEILLNTFKNEGINNFAVAIPEEGEKLRKLDKNINVIILNNSDNNTTTINNTINLRFKLISLPVFVVAKSISLLIIFNSFNPKSAFESMLKNLDSKYVC